FALDADDDPAALLAPGATETATGPARALAWLKDRAGKNIVYCHPDHAPRPLDGVDDVRLFVLGPPDGPLLRHSEPSAGEADELVSRLMSADVCFGLAAQPIAFGDSAAADAAQPFEAFYQLAYDAVKSDPHAHAHADGFFAEHYGFDDADAWRRIDTDWLNLS